MNKKFFGLTMILSISCISGNKDQVINPIQNPSPKTETAPIQSLGSNLLDCRIRRAELVCKYYPEECDRLKAEILGDGIFERIRNRTNETEFDVLLEVNTKLNTCRETLSK